jgi:hypothetical protein
VVDYSIDVRDAENVFFAGGDVKAGVLTLCPRPWPFIQGGARPAIPTASGLPAVGHSFPEISVGDCGDRCHSGNSDQNNMLDSLGSMRCRLLDSVERGKMVSFVEAL